jgi:hypothetical protein
VIRPGVKPLFRLALRRRDIVDRNGDDEIAFHLELRHAARNAVHNLGWPFNTQTRWHCN